MTFITPPLVIRKLLNRYTWKLKGGFKRIYLTFDDGPTPKITEWVLLQLKKYDAKATFFCIGRNVERHYKIYNKIISEGHSVGNHTYSHLNGLKTGNREYFNDIELAGNIIKSDLFRPPYGMIKRPQGKKLVKKYNVVMWHVLSYDFAQKISPEKCYRNVSRKIRSGSVVVFHDSEKAWDNLNYTLPKILKQFSEKGYKFEALNFNINS